MLRLRYHPDARAELRAAVNRSEDERKGRGLALEAAVERVELRLLQLKGSAPQWHRIEAPFEIRKARVQRFPYLVVYAILPDATRRHRGGAHESRTRLLARTDGEYATLSETFRQNSRVRSARYPHQRNETIWNGSK